MCGEVEEMRQDGQEGRNLHRSSERTIIESLMFSSFCFGFHTLFCLIVQRNMSALTTDDVSVVDSSLDPEKTHNTETTPFDHAWDDRSDHYEIAQVSISMLGEEEVCMYSL